jgi:hypothetical protein
VAPTQGFSISVKHDLDAFLRRLTDVEKQEVPFVTAYALTKTAQDIKDEEVKVMARVFDRPTRFTLNALFVKPATKQHLKSHVLFKEGFGSIPAWHYLGPQVEGGSRVKKSHERALERAGILKSSEFVVPGQGFPLDAQGNMPGGMLTRILSDVGANSDPLQNTTARSRKRNRRKNRGRYVVLRPGGQSGLAGSNRNVAPGIYHRVGGNALKPVLMFVSPPQYRKRFPFYETAKAVFQQRFAMRFREGWQRYVVNSNQRKAA